MKTTRRQLFAAIAAAFGAKRALPVSGINIARKHLNWCECPGCQWARGVLERPSYDWYAGMPLPSKP